MMAIIKTTSSTRIFDYKMMIDIKIVKRFCKVFIDSEIDESFVSLFLINEWEIDWKNKSESYSLQMVDKTSLLYKNGKINRETISLQLDV